MKNEQLSQQSEVKEVFAKEIRKSKPDKTETVADFDKVDKDQYKKPQKAHGLSKNQVTFLVVFFAALAVVAVLVAKYGKVLKCDDVTCTPGVDEGCICDE